MIIKEAGAEQKRYQSRLAEMQSIRAARSKSINGGANGSQSNTKRSFQINSVNSQIKAFQLLSRNLDIPTNLLDLIKAASTDADESSVTSSEPFSKDNLDTSKYEERLVRANVPLPGGKFPGSSSELSTGSTHETVISNKISQRIIELERLPGNLGTMDVRNVELDPSYTIPKSDDELKIKALIELKALRQLTKQKSMRQHIVFDLATVSDPIASSMNLRYTHKRPKPQSLQDLRITEKLENQQRMERERKERVKHINAIKGICSQAQQILIDKHTKMQRHSQLGRAILASHSQIEREEQKRAERTAKQRLQALKSNDEEAYIKLLDQTKDTRITHILRQTNTFLSSLAQRVKVQQRDTAYNPRRPRRELGEDEDEESVNYYEIAHRIKEEVNAQPNILVGGQLKEYQIKGLQWMVSLYNNNLNGILADEMGLGKTIQSISLITYLIEMKRQPGPYLVIVPLSTLTNWTMEFEKWAPAVKKIVYKGPPLARRAQQAEIRTGDFQVLLTTYEYIIKDRPLLAKIRWTHMIIDEGHRMKNVNSKLSNTINQYYTSAHRLILTGTPLQNNLGELWALLNFVLPKIFNSVKTFDEWFNTPFSSTGGMDKMELNEEESLLIIRRLHKVLRPFLLRRLKKDVEKDLPDKVEKVIKCKMSAVQNKLYEQVVRHSVIYVGQEHGHKTGVRGLNNRIMQLRKICNHPFVFEETEDLINPTHQNGDILWRVAGKFELLDRILPKFKATGHRVLMFFQMTQVMDIMEDFLRFRGIQYLRLDGGTKAEDRSEMLKVFNAPNSPYFAFLLSTRAGGLGLNLQTADTVIIYDTDWNPHQDLQAQDRAHRIGQTKEVRILRLITEESVEESILSRAHAKLEIDGKVIQAGKFDQKSTAEEQEAFLRSLLEAAESRRQQKPEEDEIDDEELNEILARSEEEQVIFKQIDEERNKLSPYGRDKRFDRLFTDEELPEELKQDISLKLNQKPAEEILGRGARKRDRVFYDDGLTEEQWLEAMDDDNDTVEEAVLRKRARADRRRERKEAKDPGVDGEVDVEEEEEDADDNNDDVKESSPQPTITGKRKRGRKPKVILDDEERGSSEQSPSLGGTIETPVQGDAPKKKGRRGRKSKAQLAEEAALAGLKPEDQDSGDSDSEKPPRKRQNLLSVVTSDLISQEGIAALDLIKASEDEDGRTRADLFLELPDRKEYSDYYQIIKKPIAIDKIEKKLSKNKYIGLEDLKSDLLLMASNAMGYNEIGSLVYEDAQEIEKLVHKWYDEATSRIAELEKDAKVTSELGTKTFSEVPSSVGDSTAYISPDEGLPAKQKGRRGKKSKEEIADEEDEQDNDSAPLSLTTDPIVKKKKGRKPKNALQANEVATQEGSELSSVPSSNGSYESNSTTVSEATGEGTTESKTNGRGRPKGKSGRPRKNKNPQDLSSLPSREDDDGDETMGEEEDEKETSASLGNEEEPKKKGRGGARKGAGRRKKVLEE